MQSDEIDEMLADGASIPHPGRWRGLDAASSRSLTENSANRGHLGGFDAGPRAAGDKFSDDVAAEILSRTHGTRESGDDFPTAATRAVERAVRRVPAESRHPAESARAIIAGVLRGAGENEDTALKTLSLTASIILREALLLGDDPALWIEGVLSGAVVGAEALGLDRENAVSAATQGILKGVNEGSDTR